MNAVEALDNSHLMLIQALDDLPDEQWDMPGVCGNWSVKETLAHLVSYEYLLIDVLQTTLENNSTPPPYLSRFVKQRDNFRAEEVEKRRYETAQHVLDAYNDAQVESTSLLERIPVETLQKTGMIPGLEKEESVKDFVLSMSRHIDEHRAQIEEFRNKKAV